jgi:hypothetical protein
MFGKNHDIHLCKTRGEIAFFEFERRGTVFLFPGFLLSGRYVSQPEVPFRTLPAAIHPWPKKHT